MGGVQVPKLLQNILGVDHKVKAIIVSNLYNKAIDEIMRVSHVPLVLPKSDPLTKEELESFSASL